MPICPICQKELSRNNLGRAAHLRKHVREGLVLERLQYSSLVMTAIGQNRYVYIVKATGKQIT